MVATCSSQMITLIMKSVLFQCLPQPEANLLAVLVLAGIELIFFIVASMGLCFGFVLETVLITQGCFSYC